MKHGLLTGACRLAIVMGAVGSLATGAFAADLASEAGDQPTAVSGVIVEGQAIVTAPAAPPLSTPFTASTITSQEVRQLPDSPTVNIQSMLNYQPSFFSTTDGPNEGINTYFRGFNSGQFAETYDGIALNDVFNGGVTNQASVVNGTILLPRNVDSVQLYRGINNPAVNSYNSLGGTIDFLPRMPTADANAQVGVSYGSFKSLDVHAQGNTGDIGGVKQFLAYDYSESDGWLSYTKDRNTNVYYSAAYDAPNGDHLSFVGVYNHNNGYSPLQTPVDILNAGNGFTGWPLGVSNEKDSDSQYLAILDFRAPLGSHVVFDQKVFGGANNYRRTSYAEPFYSGPYADQQPNSPSGYAFWVNSPYYPSGPSYDPGAVFGTPQQGTDYHFYGYSSWGVGYQPSVTISVPHNIIVVGGNMTYGQLHSREYWYGSYNMPMTPGYNDAWDEHDNRLFASAYVQDAIALFDDRLTLTPGVKYIYEHTFDNDQVGFFYPFAGSPTDDESYIAPTVGINYKFTNNLAAWFAFGQNIKFPDIGAFYGAVAQNAVPTQLPTIKPEHVNDFEAGARYEAGGLYLEADLYREDFTNTFISQFNNTTGTSNIINGGTSRYEGFEIQARDTFRFTSYGSVTPFLNYSYNHAQYTSSFSDSTSGLTVLPGEPIANVPVDLVQFGVDWNYEGFDLTARGRRIGGQFIINSMTGGTTGDKNPAYFIADIGVVKTFSLHSLGVGFGKSVQIALNVTNLFNKYYYDTFEYYQTSGNATGLELNATPGAPRAVVGRIDVNF